MTASNDAARSRLKRFLADRSGATAIEYALIAAVLGGVIIAAMQTLGTGLTDVFTTISNKLKSF